MQSFLNNALNLRDFKPFLLYNLNVNIPLIALVIVKEALYIEYSQLIDRNFLIIWLIVGQITIIKVIIIKEFLGRKYICIFIKILVHQSAWLVIFGFQFNCNISSFLSLCFDFYQFRRSKGFIWKNLILHYISVLH